MEIDKIKKEIQNIDLELEKTRELLTPIQEKVSSLVKKKNKLEKELFEIKKKDAEANLDWEYILYENGFVTEPRYNWRNEMVEENTKSLTLSGYFPEAKQSALKIGIREATLKEIVEDVNKLLPYLKEIKGRKVINIYDKDLAEYGSYSLEFIKNDVKVVKLTYGTKTILTTGDLTTCLNYIWSKLYFNSQDY